MGNRFDAKFPDRTSRQAYPLQEVLKTARTTLMGPEPPPLPLWEESRPFPTYSNNLSDLCDSPHEGSDTSRWVPPHNGHARGHPVHTRADCGWERYLGPHRASRASFLYSVPAFPSPTSPKWREESETFDLVRIVDSFSFGSKPSFITPLSLAFRVQIRLFDLRRPHLAAPSKWHQRPRHRGGYGYCLLNTCCHRPPPQALGPIWGCRLTSAASS
jgi:hypothetical protein